MLVCALRGVGGEMDASTSQGVAVEKGPHEKRLMGVERCLLGFCGGERIFGP